MLIFKHSIGANDMKHLGKLKHLIIRGKAFLSILTIHLIIAIRKVYVVNFVNIGQIKPFGTII